MASCELFNLVIVSKFFITPPQREEGRREGGQAGRQAGREDRREEMMSMSKQEQTTMFEEELCIIYI